MKDGTRQVTNCPEKKLVSSPYIFMKHFVRTSLASGVGDQLAYECLSLTPFSGQCLRNLLHSKYSSSTQAKRAQRQVNETKFDEGVDRMMNQLDYVDLSKRVKELTVQAKSDKDFQDAFNRANSELLESIKKIPPNSYHPEKPPP